uniref:non-specific serine/threonine protein kinase n=1 Tax=Parascaris univalens TaxID=6257 RepID=A0A914ZXC7_PARUN
FYAIDGRLLMIQEQIAERHRIRHGRRAPPYLEVGMLVAGKFRVRKMLGGGGFGQIFEVFDEGLKKEVAIKLGPRDHEPGRIILEQKVISALSGRPHFPQFVASGVFEDYNYIVMEMLGRNLSDLRKREPGRRLSVGTVTRVGQQCIVALKSLHDIGFIHRDIKPSNFCIGHENKRHIIYLVDFGMARRFRCSDGKVRKQRHYAGFRGTIRYVSVAIHERKEPGPVDDLWSLFYSLIELMEGTLPWTDITDADEVAEIKNNIEFDKLARLSPPALEGFNKYLRALEYSNLPNYSFLTSILKRCQPVDVTDEMPFEWETNMSAKERIAGHKTETP